VDSLLPSIPTLLVLQVLSVGPAHGYEIARRIASASDGTLLLKEGTLYPLLYKLEREGLVAAEWRGDPHGHRVRIYTLTGAGRGRLAQARSEWEARSRSVYRVLQLGG
jgi:PadR family transcriptional regulator PadR